METWNREELYADVWEQPLVKLAGKYGVSAVMIGKVCRKLKIPLPGRGYWVKQEFGKPVKRLPLPDAKDLPVVQRVKALRDSPKEATPEPTDAEWLRIVELESRTIQIDPEATRHKLVKETARSLRNSQKDSRGMLERRYSETCLDVRVSGGCLPRALDILNAIVCTLEAQGFPVSFKDHRSGAQIFGHFVPFSLVEKTRETSRREIKETPNWTRTEIEYEPNGRLEFRTGEYYSSKSVRDGKKRQLEDLLPQCVGLLMRGGRALYIRAENAKLEEIERRKKSQEMAELRQQIEEEEEKVRNLNGWVDAWLRAAQMRDFIAALEKAWGSEGQDLTPETPKGQRILWMKQQADRIDPFLVAPPSILDRKNELSSWR